MNTGQFAAVVSTFLVIGIACTSEFGCHPDPLYEPPASRWSFGACPRAWLSGTWRYDAAAREVVLTVRQTQTAEPYRLSLDVGVEPAGGHCRPSDG